MKKAIILAGPSNSGKSTLIKSLFSNKWKVINSDQEYEKELKRNNIPLKQTEWSPEQLSIAAKIQSKAVKNVEETFLNTIKTGQNFIFDTTGGSYKKVIEKHNILKESGYDVFVIMLYVNPLVSLERNIQRGLKGERELKPNIILSSWSSTINNIEKYQEFFGNNISVIDNNPEKTKKVFSKELVQPFLQRDKAKGKQKERSPEEIEKLRKRKEKMYSTIQELVEKSFQFDTIEEMKEKLKEFLK